MSALVNELREAAIPAAVISFFIASWGSSPSVYNPHNEILGNIAPEYVNAHVSMIIAGGVFLGSATTSLAKHIYNKNCIKAVFAIINAGFIMEYLGISVTNTLKSLYFAYIDAVKDDFSTFYSNNSSALNMVWHVASKYPIISSLGAMAYLANYLGYFKESNIPNNYSVSSKAIASDFQSISKSIYGFVALLVAQTYSRVMLNNFLTASSFTVSWCEPLVYLAAFSAIGAFYSVKQSRADNNSIARPLAAGVAAVALTCCLGGLLQYSAYSDLFAIIIIRGGLSYCLKQFLVEPNPEGLIPQMFTGFFNCFLYETPGFSRDLLPNILTKVSGWCSCPMKLSAFSEELLQIWCIEGAADTTVSYIATLGFSAR